MANKLSWFHYSQNNSFGEWKGPKNVLVQAPHAKVADELAQLYAGVYFEGCETGEDCSCCGDRWSRAWQNEGTEVPAVWGDAVSPSPNHLFVYVDGSTEGGK